MITNDNKKIVGFDPLKSLNNPDKNFSPRLLNYVEPYVISGFRKTLFYTEVNSGLKVGDRVFILNGNYDNDLLIKLNKYKKGRDGYKVLFVDKCKIVLDINFTGKKVWEDDNLDQFIKIRNIKTQEDFIHVNREITTRGGNFNYKYSYYQNNIIFTESNFPSMNGWGKNSGLYGSPGFFIRDIYGNWTNITSSFMSGSFSNALSTTYTSNKIVKILNDTFTYGGFEFKEGFDYKWGIKPENDGIPGTQSQWNINVLYSKSILTKGNFRDGNFTGSWNTGVYGRQDKKLTWDGKGDWNNGTLLNTIWKEGVLNSEDSLPESYLSEFDEYGNPFQKINSINNNDRGYNYIIDSEFENSTINNGSLINTKLGDLSKTFSMVENHLLGSTQSYKNNVTKAFFDSCVFNDSFISNSEIKKSRSSNTIFDNVKSINSNYNSSVIKNSNYISDEILKVLDYDEFNITENPDNPITAVASHKVYKFYISRINFERLKLGDGFYIRGLKINDNKKDVIKFFDRKFRLGSWTEYIDYHDSTMERFVKMGIEYSAFLSTDGDNEYRYNTINNGSSLTGITQIIDINKKKNYSIDIVVNKNIFEKLDFNTDSTNLPNYGTMSNSLGNIIDIDKAYIIDSDFDSGIFENSNWNSGNHIELNNDNNLTVDDNEGGLYNITLLNSKLIVNTLYNSSLVPEMSNCCFEVDSIVFLNNVDYEESGVITKLPDTYKIISNNSGILELEEVTSASYSVLSSLLPGGIFYTDKALNRYGYIHKSKFNKSKIKGGLFRRSYIKGSFIENDSFDVSDKDYNNLEKVRSLVISDSIFRDNDNILSKGLYMNSSFVLGSDNWLNGLGDSMIWNNAIFNNGVIKNTRWIDGIFKNGIFYNSKTFNDESNSDSPFHYSENIKSYYKSGTASNLSSSPKISNNRNSWENGIFENGEFYKSDWENGEFKNGRFYNSKFYDGVINGGFIGSLSISMDDTYIYNGLINYTTVENATFMSKDTSNTGDSFNTHIIWKDGIFNGGVFRTNPLIILFKTFSNLSTWENGIFNGGEFTNDAKWKNGTFNGGKFTTRYGYQLAGSPTQSVYGWENGIFNGGEFGNADLDVNSIWYTGEFNGGKFTGRYWNTGVLTGGVFEGSGTYTPVGGYNVDGMTTSNAYDFVESYTQSYYGLWNDGYFTNVKDKFIKDKKIFTILERSNKRIDPITAKFENALWLGGTFSHPSGEFKSSVWLDGGFETGKFKLSSFNPWVNRNGATSRSFNLDDNSCVWNNGVLEDSDFYISKWNQGKWLSGTAFGMIWKNGISNYMNAYNICWHDGTWRNGNWQGSYFNFDGCVTDPFNKQILYRVMNCTGTSSTHVWNVFKGIDDDITFVDKPNSNPTRRPMRMVELFLLP